MTDSLEMLREQDYLFVSDLEARLEELEGERDLYEQGGGSRDEWENEEYDRLSDICSDGRSIFGGEWEHMSLIRDSHWYDYAQDTASEFGIDTSGLEWPLCHIDWNAAADSLQMDYSSIEIDGVTYWGRA